MKYLIVSISIISICFFALAFTATNKHTSHQVLLSANQVLSDAEIEERFHEFVDDIERETVYGVVEQELVDAIYEELEQDENDAEVDVEDDTENEAEKDTENNVENDAENNAENDAELSLSEIDQPLPLSDSDIELMGMTINNVDLSEDISHVKTCSTLDKESIKISNVQNSKTEQSKNTESAVSYINDGSGTLQFGPQETLEFGPQETLQFVPQLCPGISKKRPYHRKRQTALIRFLHHWYD